MRRCAGPCNRELFDSSFTRHSKKKRGPKVQTICHRCQIEKEIDITKARLEELLNAWWSVKANEVRADMIRTSHEQTLFHQSGERSA